MNGLGAGYGWKRYELLLASMLVIPVKEECCNHGVLISWLCVEHKSRFDTVRRPATVARSVIGASRRVAHLTQAKPWTKDATC